MTPRLASTNVRPWVRCRIYKGQHDQTEGHYNKTLSLHRCSIKFLSTASYLTASLYHKTMHGSWLQGVCGPCCHGDKARTVVLPLYLIFSYMNQWAHVTWLWCLFLVNKMLNSNLQFLHQRTVYTNVPSTPMYSLHQCTVYTNVQSTPTYSLHQCTVYTNLQFTPMYSLHQRTIYTNVPSTPT